MAPDTGRNLPLNFIQSLRKETTDVPSGVLNNFKYSDAIDGSGCHELAPTGGIYTDT